MTLLPPLPPLPGVPQLPLPFPVSGVNSYPLQPAEPGTPAAMLLPPLPALPPVRIYSQGRQVTPWYPMRVLPCADRKGEYEVQFDNAPESLEWWDGKRWPSLAGNFHAIGWRGLAHAHTPPVA